MVLVIQALVAAVLYYLVGQSPLDPGSWPRFVAAGAPFALFPVAYLLKLFTVPPILAKEAEVRHQEALSKLRGEVEVLSADRNDLARRIEVLQAPPSPPIRDPDGVYQYGRFVGKVHMPNPLPHQSVVHFVSMTTSGDFAAAATFEYRDYVLKISQWNSRNVVSLGGNTTVQLGNVLCHIEGRTQPGN